MLKRVINAVIGSRHERERKKIQPIVDEINEHYARLHDVSEEELRAQTAKFRQTIEERTGELERRVAELKEQKRAASDIVERDRIDVELGGARNAWSRRPSSYWRAAWCRPFYCG